MDFSIKKLKKINEINHVYIITPLNYRKQTTKVLKNVSFDKNIDGKLVLIDNALVSGMNDYRFISMKVIDSKIDISSAKYIDPCEKIVRKANKILKSYPKWLENSILTKSQKNKIRKEEL